MIISHGAKVFSHDIIHDGKPYEVKVSRTVWGGGKDRDNFKVLPITIEHISWNICKARVNR